jgi:excisionase family DNA binding protein
MPNVEVSSDQKLLHSKKTTARLLDISPRSVDNLIADKKLTPVHIGRRCLIRHSDLLRFVRKGTE